MHLPLPTGLARGGFPENGFPAESERENPVDDSANHHGAAPGQRLVVRVTSPNCRRQVPPGLRAPYKHPNSCSP